MRHATLNHIYRLVWSTLHQTWVAVSELTRGQGKKTMRRLAAVAGLAAVALMPLAQAGPIGGQVTAGSGTISQSGTTTTVNQASQNLSVNWQSFNTNSAETVNFSQPSTSAIAVNRIGDQNPTQFLGKLNANGQVYLINPNGIVFGAGAQVNVGGLVASTLDTTDSKATGSSRTFSGAGTGSVVNKGTITTANGGYVAFVGKHVENQGTVTAPGGAAALAAGSDVTLSFTGDKLVNLQVNKSTVDTLAENGGLVQADGGAVWMSAGARDTVLASVVNNSGIVQARSVQNINGTIVLEAGSAGTTTNSGTLDVAGTTAGQHGGSAKVLGGTVNLTADSRIDASGDAGGGTALVGGNFKGLGPEQNALNTTVAAGSRIDANARSSGKGGQVAVWSNGTTAFNGKITARGGSASGDGGAVETSGKTLKIGSEAMVNTLAPKGTAGDWLLDPQDFRIGGYTPGDGDIDAALITNALSSSNVTIKTGPTFSCNIANCSSSGSQSGNGDIILVDGSSIGSGWSSNTVLTLSAYRNIVFNGTAGIDTTSGAGNVVLRAGNAGNGVGTILFNNDARIDGGTGTFKLYYNPTSYSTPTDFVNVRNGNGDLVFQYNSAFTTAQVSSYMLINVAATVANKTYDGSTAASLTGLASQGTLPSGITIDYSGASAAFADKNVGTNKAVAVSGVTLSGSNAGDYDIAGLDVGTATISKANLGLSGFSIADKAYDGTTAATLTGTGSVAAFGSDVVSLAGSGSAAFADKNAGAGKAVTISGFTLTGADAGNYNLVRPTNLTANITKANLSVTGVAAANKTYDGTTAANVVGSATVNAYGSDAVTVSGSGSASFTDKNAGTGKTVTVNGFTLAGADAGNYNLVQPSGLTATISKASLVLGGLSVSDKVYDGTTVATLSGTATANVIGGDVVSVAGSGSAVFSDKNAGANKAVNVSGYSLTGADAGNYNLVQPSGLAGTIRKADLLLSGLGINNKVYDGTTAATLSGTGSVSAFGGDVVSVSGSGSAAFADKNVGNGKAATVSGYTLSDADAGNYNLVRPTGLTASIAKANLDVTGVAAANKTYDGTTAANVVGSATVNAFGSDVVAVAGSSSASFADKNAGSGKAVTVSGYTLTGTDAGNYNLVQPRGLTANISKAVLALAGLGVSDKIYDGTTAATLSGTGSVTAFGGDDVLVTGTGSAAFADKNAGVGKAVNVGGYTLGGADATNYTLVQPGGLTATISKAGLLLSGLAANSKVYDGTTAATLSGTGSVAAFGSDVVSVSGSATATFADKNAGTGKAVNVSGYTLSGADAGNYNVVQPTGLTADISKATLNVTGVAAADKTYDGTTAATLTGAATVSALGSDAVAVTGGSATFADKSAGSGKAVTASGYTLTGADADNYNLVQPGGLTASISKATLILTGLGVSDKVYDGTAAATLTGTGAVNGLGSDVVSVTGTGSAAFADKNAGVGKAVNASGYSLAGADGDNYSLVQPVGLTATIRKADLLLAGLGVSNKVYDGTTAATLTGPGTVTALGNDVVSVAGGGTGAFADKNVGNGKAVAVSGYTLAGTDAGNYNLRLPTTLAADITPATLSLSGVIAADKVFDGTQRADIDTRNALLAGLVSGDAVGLVSTGTFADAAVGAGKVVSLNNGLSGSDSANYTLTGQATALASITAAAISPDPLPAPAVPEAPLLQRSQRAVAQVQSTILPTLAASQPRALTLSSTLEVRDLQQDSAAGNVRNDGSTTATFVNTSTAFGTQAPQLSIQNGGVQLPPVAVSVTQ